MQLPAGQNPGQGRIGGHQLDDGSIRIHQRQERRPQQLHVSRFECAIPAQDPRILGMGVAEAAQDPQAEALGLDHQRPDRNGLAAVAQHQDARCDPLMAEMPEPVQAPAAGLKPVERCGMPIFELPPGRRKGLGFGERPEAVNLQ